VAQHTAQMSWPKAGHARLGGRFPQSEQSFTERQYQGPMAGAISVGPPVRTDGNGSGGV